MKKIFYRILSNSFGDTLAATPTLRHLSKSHNQKINVVTHNKNVFHNNQYVDECLSFEEYKEQNNSTVYTSFTHAGRKDGNGIEKKFSRIDTRQLHSMDLGFQLLPEEMEYDFYPKPLELDLSLPEKYVVLHITTNWPNRTWSEDNWQKLINWLSHNKIFTVLIGFGYREELHGSYSEKPLDKICPNFKNLYGTDLTNQGSIDDMWWVLNGAQCLITMDSGPLHLAGTTDVEIIQLGSALNPKLRTPYRKGTQDYKYHFVGGTCNIFCNSDLKYNVKVWGDINSVPPQPLCLENKPTFECHPPVDKVIDTIKSILNHQETPQPVSTVSELSITKPNSDLRFGLYTSFYNCERFVDTIFTKIESINYDNFEWHITDDFSSDDTKSKILERLDKSTHKSKIKFIEQSEKKEMYWKPNLFFDKTFDWIVLLDSDDDFDTNFLRVYNLFLNGRDDVSFVSSDFVKQNEDSGSLHSISYVINDDIISKKIDRYHPTCDYLNNLSYYCFGVLRGFRNKIDEFVIDDMLACAEDSYHVFWGNSYGKYLHIPRPLYVWQQRSDSESHSTTLYENFNGNFKRGLSKLQSSDFGVDMTFNDIYIETSSLGSFPFGKLKNTSVSLWTRFLSENQKNKIVSLYQDSMINFCEKESEIHIICLNYYSENELDILLPQIKNKKILMYYQNQKHHNTNEEKDKELSHNLEKYKSVVVRHLSGFSWWSYIRHFTIKNI